MNLKNFSKFNRETKESYRNMVRRTRTDRRQHEGGDCTQYRLHNYGRRIHCIYRWNPVIVPCVVCFLEKNLRRLSRCGSIISQSLGSGIDSSTLMQMSSSNWSGPLVERGSMVLRSIASSLRTISTPGALLGKFLNQ